MLNYISIFVFSENYFLYQIKPFSPLKTKRVKIYRMAKNPLSMLTNE